MMVYKKRVRVPKVHISVFYEQEYKWGLTVNYS
jgi:hypothetical protein